MPRDDLCERPTERWDIQGRPHAQGDDDVVRRVLWPKLLEGIAAEAISLADAKKAEKPAASEEVMKFITKAEESPATKKPLQGSLKHVSAESDETCLFETADDKNDGKWLRRSILKK